MRESKKICIYIVNSISRKMFFYQNKICKLIHIDQYYLYLLDLKNSINTVKIKIIILGESK